ncbi:MAG: aminotransferase class III-fold pyridoxal phosphate-dependent enzyme [Candidatus Obscuribacterales bacterium]|nr:aminotransferase class III-fold pyridoxal phosphate-dependent enzyme [Candidatus Obscuribacterales bacterium]
MSTAKTMTKNQEYIERDDKCVNPVLSRLMPIVAERGEGSYLYDVDGVKYLDLTTGIGVTNVGHCHPQVVKAIKYQAEKLIHTSVTTYHKNYIELCEKLAKIAPGNLDSVMLANSGAECVEGAIKLARWYTGRPGIINFLGGFHGRTHMCMALTTSKLYYRDMQEPLPSAIFTAPFPYVYRSATPGDAQKVLDHTFEQIEKIFHHFVNPKQIAAFIVEPILGEGGYVLPPDGFLKRLAKVADEHGILLIIDEVQTGFGRTGKMFASEHEGVTGDIMTIAKGIGAGMPISAFIAKKEITKDWPKGRHGTTFGGNPIACAAALASIKVIEEEKLVERSKVMGDMFVKRLREFAKGKSHIGEIRGRGLMIGIEFNDKDGKPSKQWADKVAKRCFENKMLVLTCGQDGQVIRLIPPLNISDKEAEEALSILETAMKNDK